MGTEEARTAVDGWYGGTADRDGTAGANTRGGIGMSRGRMRSPDMICESGIGPVGQRRCHCIVTITTVFVWGVGEKRRCHCIVTMTTVFVWGVGEKRRCHCIVTMTTVFVWGVGEQKRCYFIVTIATFFVWEKSGGVTLLLP